MRPIQIEFDPPDAGIYLVFCADTDPGGNIISSYGFVKLYENRPFGGVDPATYSRLAQEAEAMICAKWGYHI